MAIDSRQRTRVTATSLVRQLEQHAAATTAARRSHVDELKLQATLRHVKQLLTTLQQSDPNFTSSLKQRVSKAEQSLAKRNTNQSTRGGDTDPAASLDFDFLAPSVPLYPSSSTSPSSSPGPGYGGGTPRAYSPIKLDREPYSPAVQQPNEDGDGDDRPQWGADLSIRAQQERQNRSRAGTTTSEYDPDNYSPVHARSQDPFADSSANTAIDKLAATESAPPPIRNDDDFDDPEADMGFGQRRGSHDDDDDDGFDPESGGMSFVSSDRNKAKSPSPARSRNNQSLPPPPPPARKSSVGSTSRDQLLGGTNEGLRQRPRATSNLSRQSATFDDQDDDDDALKSTAAGASTSELLSHHHDIQNTLMSSLTNLSSQLKSSSLAFADNLEKDKAVMHDAKSKLEDNYDRMKKEGGRLGTVRKKARGTTCWTIGVIAAVAFAWVVMFFLIRVT